MRFLYSIAFYLSTPFILLHFAIRGLKDRRYIQRWNERFGWYKGPAFSGGVVDHAASVGELNAAGSLIRALHEKPSAQPLLITTFTPTGSSRAKILAGKDMLHFYAPLDLPGAVKRFFEHTKPRLLIIMETEIWPNLLHQASRRNIPVLMANARMSDQSFINYRRYSGLTKEALSTVGFVGAQSQIDLNRLVACGVNPDRITASGNLKFDLEIPAGLQDNAEKLRQKWGADRPVLIAGSTHAQDDLAVLQAFGMILKALPDTLLILVPRHPERFSATHDLCVKMGLRTELFSNGPWCSPQAQCFVIDAMGELQRYYACSDLAVIGGSFGTTGGHNPLEASALGIPVMVGPDTVNFAEITESLVTGGAAIRVLDANGLGEAVIALLGNPDERRRMGDSGKQLLAQGRGALRITLDAVEKLAG